MMEARAEVEAELTYLLEICPKETLLQDLVIAEHQLEMHRVTTIAILETEII